MSRCCCVVAAAMIKSVCPSVDELILGFPGVILALFTLSCDIDFVISRGKMRGFSIALNSSNPSTDFISSVQDSGDRMAYH